MEACVGSYYFIISIHAPVKGATLVIIVIVTRDSDFNPRSREGSDEDYQCLLQALDISIHAPVKGATRAQQSCHVSHRISIHAPVKGATGCPGHPRAQRRISIHAPVKGATTARDFLTAILKFQSTLP